MNTDLNHDLNTKLNTDLNQQTQSTPQEFLNFVQGESVFVPQDLNQRVLKMVQRKLQPTWFYLLSKLLLIQLVVGGLTLLFCPQFGIDPLGGGQGFLAILLKQGPLFCAASCGIIFIGSSALASLFVLRREELRQVKKHSLSLLAVLSSVALFLLLGISQGLALPNHHQGISFSLVWWLAALASGIFWIHLGGTLRRQLFS